MRKKSIIKKARFLSQAEETSCILEQQNSKTKGNEDNSPSETSKLKTEIESFMDDTGNELRFYLEDNNIRNDTEKCKKASSYINWRGMDYVNLLLNEKEKYNISCLVEKWKEKQNSFQTSIVQKTNSACNEKTFDYCAILNKNDKCTRPYEYNDLPVSTSLTYEQLKEDTYSTNKTQIIEDRRLSFLNITNDMSDYYYRMYEYNKSPRNCGKWSMYIYKRGKQFVNMAENELYENQLYVNHSIKIWNDHSNTLQNIELRDTGIQCNMTTLIHQIKERQNTDDPYNLDWLSSNSTQNESNETSNNTTTLPDALQPTIVTPNELHDTTTGSLGNNTTSVNNVNGASPSENTLTSDTSVTPVAVDQTSPEAAITVSPENSTQSNSLTPNKTIHPNTNTTSDTTSSSHSPEVVASPATSLPSETVTSVNKITSTNCNSSVTNDTATDSMDIKTTNVNNVNGTNGSENTLTSDTSVPTVAADQIFPGTALTISPDNSTQSNSLTPKVTIHSDTNTISNTTSSSHSPEVPTSPATEILPSNSTTSSGTPSVTPLHGEISPTATNEYSTTTAESLENNITPSTTPTKSPETSLPSETVTSVNKITSTNGNSSVTNDTATDSMDIKTTNVNNVNGTNASENTLTRDTSVPPVAADQIAPETATAISPEDSTQSNSLTPKVTIHPNTNTISNTTSSSHTPELVTSPATETLPSNSTTSSGTPSVTPSPGEISPTATNEYSNTTMKIFTNNITPSTTYTKSPPTLSLPSETVTSVNKTISTIGNTSATNVTASPSIDPISSSDITPSLTTMTTTPTDDS
ncbi:surface-associated interspersed protein (SURFIN), partial [Plasmodium gallinaceum]